MQGNFSNVFRATLKHTPYVVMHAVAKLKCELKLSEVLVDFRVSRASVARLILCFTLYGIIAAVCLRATPA